MSDQRNRYTYSLVYDRKSPKGRWQIIDMGDKGYCSSDDPVIWTIENAVLADPDSDMHPPREVRAEYERLIGFDPLKAPPPTEIVNIVEVIADGDDCAFDQPCAYGHRVDGHAVYCHNDWWLYAPRKCRRSWYTGGETRDEDCEGYRPNGAKAS